MSINLLDVQLPEEETNSQICLICHDTLEGCHNYTLPECKHTYHTECIVTWFRKENQANCPYCGNKGINNKERKGRNGRRMPFFGYRRSRMGCSPLFQDMINYSKRKDAPKILLKKIEELRTIENKLKENKKEIQQFNNMVTSELTSKEIINKSKNLRSKGWEITRRINDKKVEISLLPIVPIIIPRVVDMS